MGIIRNFGLAHKIGYVTGDNDAKNDTCLRQFAQDLKEEFRRTFDPVASRTRCAGHIINLSLQAFLLATSEDALRAAMKKAQDELNETTVADALHDNFLSRSNPKHGRRCRGFRDSAGWRAIGPLGVRGNCTILLFLFVFQRSEMMLGKTSQKKRWGSTILRDGTHGSNSST